MIALLVYGDLHATPFEFGARAFVSAGLPVVRSSSSYGFMVPAGFVAFVLQLKKHQYIAQFGQFAWTHMILLCVFIPSSFFVSNIFDGLIWFLLPCSLVILNDIGAYLTGVQSSRSKYQTATYNPSPFLLESCLWCLGALYLLLTKAFHRLD